MPTGLKDLTLREGAQVPGLDIDEAAGEAVLGHLADLGVERVEVAFPRARPRESWYRRADELGLATAALARAVPADVDAALAVEPDEVEVIVTASDVQLEHALGRSREAALDLLCENVERAAAGGVAAGATLMDAVRADDGFLRAAARAVRAAGAGHVTLADTTGAGAPDEVAAAVGAVADAVGDDIGVAFHGHDDLGLGTANALAAVDAGADSLDVTVGGVGERVGNVALEEAVVALEEKRDGTDADASQLVPACRAVLGALGMEAPADKPVLGELAYRHESGMHTAAMLREPATYEPFDPTAYGAERTLLFGAGTGRGAARALLEDAGREPTDEAVAALRDALREAAAERGADLALAGARALAER